MELLAHTIVASEAGTARRTIVLLHGIYGRGRNWAAIARGLAARRPEWAAALVDLRLARRLAGLRLRRTPWRRAPTTSAA